MHLNISWSPGEAIWWNTRLGAFPYLKTEAEAASETQYTTKIKTMDKVQRHKITSPGNITNVKAQQSWTWNLGTANVNMLFVTVE